MSIELRHVGKIVHRGMDARALFKDVDFRIEAGARIAVLGLPKSGKTTLLRLICGTDYADAGTIDRTSSVSWPIPMADFLVAYSSVAANMNFIMRLYGIDDDGVISKLAELVDISEFLNVRLAQCPRHVRQRLAFALGVGLGFDVCLFDERVAGVDKEFKPKAIEIVKAITAPRAIVVATSNPKEVADVCDTVFVLENSELTQFQNAEEGFAHFKSLVAKGTEEDSDIPDAGPEPAEEEFVLEVGI